MDQKLKDIITSPKGYWGHEGNIPAEDFYHTADLCYRLNSLPPSDTASKEAIYQELFGTWNPEATVDTPFRCDYGFNIHFSGRAYVNYDCVMMDTAPIHIGKNVFIAPRTVFTCAAHAFLPDQRAEWISSARPITIGDDVWISANVTICGGVTIGDGAVIGAGAVVTRDIPAGVVAGGVPCRVIRRITEEDRVPEEDILF